MNNMDHPTQLNPDEMQRVLNRNRFSMQMLAERIGMLSRENVELMSIVQELQSDLFATRAALYQADPKNPVLPPLPDHDGLPVDNAPVN